MGSFLLTGTCLSLLCTMYTDYTPFSSLFHGVVPPLQFLPSFLPGPHAPGDDGRGTGGGLMSVTLLFISYTSPTTVYSSLLRTNGAPDATYRIKQIPAGLPNRPGPLRTTRPPCSTSRACQASSARSSPSSASPCSSSCYPRAPSPSYRKTCSPPSRTSSCSRARRSRPSG